MARARKIRRSSAPTRRAKRDRASEEGGRASEEGGRASEEGGSRFFVELDVHDPSALDLEINFTDRAERLYRTGHRLLTRGYFAEAADLFERATRYDRAHYLGYVGRVETLVILGQEDEAATVVNAALDRYGRNSDIGSARGHVFLHQGEAETALECADIAMANAPDSAYVQLIGGEVRLAIRGGLSSAADCFVRAREAVDRWPNLDVRIALAFLEWGHFDQALPALRAVVREDPNLALAWILLGDAYGILGKRRQSLQCYRRVALLSPDLPWVREKLHWKSRLKERWRGFRRAVRRALAPP